MSGTKAGGKKAAQVNLSRNPNFYKEIGSKGGKVCGYKGFAANPKLAKEAGLKGALKRAEKYRKIRLDNN